MLKPKSKSLVNKLLGEERSPYIPFGTETQERPVGPALTVTLELSVREVDAIEAFIYKPWGPRAGAMVRIAKKILDEDETRTDDDGTDHGDGDMTDSTTDEEPIKW